MPKPRRRRKIGSRSGHTKIGRLAIIFSDRRYRATRFPLVSDLRVFPFMTI